MTVKEKKSKPYKGIKADNGKLCHFPFKYTKSDGREHTFKTCTEFDHYGDYWCCTDEHCSDQSQDNIGICPFSVGLSNLGFLKNSFFP